MIVVHTGQPGAGKTLFTLWHVKQQAEKEGRTVYYSGVADCKVPGWVELEDPTKWFDLPAGAIVVIDEAQRIFRPRGNGSVVPEYVSRLETHRHQGIDLYVITQHPMLIDSNVRRLTGKHRHVVRAFGSKYATVHEWGEIREQCDKSRSDSIKTQFPYPKEVFGWYKSAELHTHKASIPFRVWGLLLIPLVLAACAWGFYRWYSGFGSRITEKAAPGAVESESASPFAPRAEVSGRVTAAPAQSREEWLQAQAPRIEGLAYTAPVYDEVTKPVHAPYPAACVAMKTTGCRCYSQQGTRLDVPAAVCGQIVERGWFVAWDTRSESAPANPVPSQAPAPVARNEPETLSYGVIADGGKWHGRHGYGQFGGSSAPASSSSSAGVINDGPPPPPRVRPPVPQPRPVTS